MLKTVAHRGQAFVLPRLHHGRSPSGVPLPPRPYRMGGAHFRADDAFVASAVDEVGRLERLVGLGPGSRLVDWGCGAGRLAVGIVERMGRTEHYHGVDVQRHLIEWARRHLGTRDGFEFTYVDLANARYNPGGSGLHSIPGATGAADAFYAYSVFSHLLGADAAAYLREVGRLLAPGGRALVTAFVEEGVPHVEENPPGYGPLRWSGPLHCVRFERGHFEGLVEAAGLEVHHFEHGGETDGQSLYVLRRP